MSTTAVKKRDYLTLMQVVAAVAVVTLHTNSCFYEYSTERYWVTANIIENVCCFSVPVFFMITGITLIDFYDKYSLTQFFMKRFKKTYIPFFVWNTVGLIYKIAWGMIKPESLSVKFLYEGFTNNTFVAIFWFFNALFCVYLSVPLFAAVSKEKRIKVFSYLTMFGLLFNYFIPFLKRAFTWDFNWPFTFGIFGGYLIFVPLGVLLDFITSDHKKKLWGRIEVSICLLGIMSLLVSIIGTQILSDGERKIVSTYKGFISFPGIMWASCVFILLKKTSGFIMRGIVGKTIRIIGNYTFEIYLMQYFIYDMMTRLLPINTKSIMYRLGGPWAVVVAVIALTYILRRIPGIRKVVP